MPMCHRVVKQLGPPGAHSGACRVSGRPGSADTVRAQSACVAAPRGNDRPGWGRGGAAHPSLLQAQGWGEPRDKLLHPRCPCWPPLVAPGGEGTGGADLLHARAPLQEGLPRTPGWPHAALLVTTVAAVSRGVRAAGRSSGQPLPCPGRLPPPCCLSPTQAALPPPRPPLPCTPRLPLPCPPRPSLPHPQPPLLSPPGPHVGVTSSFLMGVCLVFSLHTPGVLEASLHLHWRKEGRGSCLPLSTRCADRTQQPGGPGELAEVGGPSLQ